MIVPIIYLGLYIMAAAVGLYAFARWIGVIINIGFLLFMACFLILIIALTILPS